MLPRHVEPRGWREASKSCLPLGLLFVVLLLGASSGGLAEAQAAVDPASLRTQNFDGDPTCASGAASTSVCWEGSNNRLVPGSCPTTSQSFGYSSTANASTSPGEVGGTEWNSYTRAYYAKALPQSRSLNSALSASGTLWIKEGAKVLRDGYVDQGRGLLLGGPLFGFFNKDSLDWRTPSSLALRLEESDGPGLFVAGVEYATQNYKAVGKWLLTPGGSTHLVTSTRYRWNLSYDPAGANGNGRITFSITGFGSTTLDLSAGHKSAGAVFDRFGMLNRMIEGNEATVYFGDLTINGIPENLGLPPSDWAGDGNSSSFADCVIDNRHDFGYTGNGTSEDPGKAPAPANAAGGVLWRTEPSGPSTGKSAYYADRIAPLDLNKEFYAEGTVRLERASSDSAINFGFFKASTVDLGQGVPHNFVGINTDGPSSVGWYFRPALRSSTGSTQRPSSGPTILPDGAVRQWTLHYVPSSGGGATLTVTLGGQTVSQSISSSVRGEGATLDRFGMRNVTQGGHAQIIYLDDLKYTAPPTSTLTPPTGLTATAGDQSVALDWADNTESDLAGYNVYRATAPGGPYTKLNTELVPKTTSNFTDTSNLTNGTTYYYVVKAVDTATPTPGESPASNEASATPTDGTVPAAPTGLTASAEDQSVSLDWVDNSETDLAGYNVYRSTSSTGPYTKVNDAVVTTSDYQDTDVTNGTTYYYVVKAVDTSGNESADSDEAEATPEGTPTDSTPPDPPTGLEATPGNREVALKWSENTESDLAGYNVYRSTRSGRNYSKVNGSLITSSDFIDTGRKNGKTYYYVVRAVDDSGNESDPSDEASATPRR